MLLIFPFNMLSSYIGFKEAVYFKQKFSRKLLFSKTLKVISLSSALYWIAAISIYITKNISEVYVNLEILIGCYCLITAKFAYSLASSAMGALGSEKEIWGANIFSALVIVPSYLSAATHPNLFTIENIIWLFSTLWATRTIIFIIYLGNKNV
ncbi:hypothetical protein D3C76_1294010 [compost metagenome]